MTDSTSRDASRWIDRRMALAREWDDLVEQVRQLPGFEDFLRPPPLEKLLPAAEGGPIAVVNISRWRCDALLVTTGGVDVVPLPGLDVDTVRARTAGYLDALDGRGYGPLPKGFQAAKDELKARRQAREDAVRSTMEWLWDTVAEPVLTALNLTHPAEPGTLPRLWWCPTGVLTLLPVHGAGYHDGSGRAVVERVVSSYTPTLRALSEARRAAKGEGEPRMLVVAAPDAPGLPELPDVDRESEFLRGLFPGRCRVLTDDEAVPREVLAAMISHPWVHFSCHGFQNLEDPSRAGLSLTGGELRVTDISAGHFHGDLAFLSACQSATGGVNLPDEAITLTAAIHYTGYRHVIGTLWSVYDDSAADVAEAFYVGMSAQRFDADAAARALHGAITTVRRRRHLPLLAWLPYTHTGP